MRPNKNMMIRLAACTALACAAMGANASTFTSTSPLSGDLPSGVSTIGGLVLDLYGANGSHVVSQLSAASLFQGFANSNPFVVGVQSGFSSSVVSALGGGLSGMAVRFTLYDGDSAAGNFDAGTDLSLLVNGVSLGYWGSVTTQTTSSTGVASGNSTHQGFADNLLDTGWFYTTNSATLASFYSTLSSGSVSYGVYDKDAGDNYFDFRQGLNSSLLNVSLGPTVATAAVPEPESYALMLAGLGALVAARRRKA